MTIDGIRENGLTKAMKWYRWDEQEQAKPRIKVIKKYYGSVPDSNSFDSPLEGGTLGTMLECNNTRSQIDVECTTQGYMLWTYPL